MSEIKCLRVRSVHEPTRGTDFAAGIDFYVPECEGDFLRDLINKNPNINARYELKEKEIQPLTAAGPSTMHSYDLYITLMPQARILIPSGVKTFMEPGTALIAANKSGIASKKGLAFLAEVVDSDYSGELHINVVNTGTEPVVIKTGEKLIQFVHTPVILSKIVETDVRTFNSLHDGSLRGDLGFGSGVDAATKNN